MFFSVKQHAKLHQEVETEVMSDRNSIGVCFVIFGACWFMPASYMTITYVYSFKTYLVSECEYFRMHAALSKGYYT